MPQLVLKNGRLFDSQGDALALIMKGGIAYKNVIS
jgi:hypothetical protein